MIIVHHHERSTTVQEQGRENTSSQPLAHDQVVNSLHRSPMRKGIGERCRLWQDVPATPEHSASR
jgi:hypothetical protein